MTLAADFEFTALREAKNYRKAIIREFQHFLRGRVLEIGAGIGQITAVLASQPDVEQVLAVEPEQSFVERFDRSSPKIQVLHGTASHVGSRDWNVILSVNVLEHIEHDSAELCRYRELLAPRSGFLCMLVPACPELYSPLDRDFGHFRRYQTGELDAKMEETGFAVERQFYFNKVGVLAWWLGNTLFGQRTITVWQLKLYNVLTPIFRLLDRLLPTTGLSTVVVARKKS